MTERWKRDKVERDYDLLGAFHCMDQLMVKCSIIIVIDEV